MRSVHGRPVRGLVALIALALVAAGCGVTRVAAPPVDDLSTWSPVPLAPDQALADRISSGQTSCIPGPQGGPVRVLLQDRRTAWTAAFLFTAAGVFGSCFVTKASGGSGGGSGPRPEPMAANLSIDDNGFGDVAGGQAHDLGGRIAVGVASVRVELAGGGTATASVGNGYWLAWWPGNVVATKVRAFGADGAEIESLDVPK
jgi:hypothetical protein